MLEGQPWAMGYFVWQFHSSSDRNDCLLQIKSCIYSLENKNFGNVVDQSKLLLDDIFPHLYMCVTGKIQELTIFES